MIVSDNPRDYHLPADKWWPQQKTMIERVANLRRGDTLFIEAPTGTGKSFGPAFSSLFRTTTALVATRDLQQQYQDSFGDRFKIVWGRTHYPCVLPSRIKSFTDTYGIHPSRDDCTYKKVGDCPVFAQCPYERAKSIAMGSPARTLNYAYAFYARWWQEQQGVLFCDEAHALPGVLSNLISLEISKRTQQIYGLPQFPLLAGSGTSVYRKTCQWLTDAGRELSHPTRFSSDERKLKQRTLLAERITQLKESLEIADEDSWYVASGQALGKLLARPVFVGQYATRLFSSSLEFLTLMSATIGDPEILINELGLEVSHYDSISLPHIFKPQNRPVLWVKSAPALSRKSTDQDYLFQAQLISDILTRHKEHRGLIHTTSWAHTKILATRLSSLGHEDRILIPRGERVLEVQRFKKSPEGTVAISPSWREGLNFPDGEARFAICAKIPFPSLSDPVIRLRLRAPGGRRWYDWRACIGVVQAAGRIVRHIEDWGITYILDSNWRRVARLAPKWFEIAEA